MALFLTTKHSLQLRKGAEGLGCPRVTRSCCRAPLAAAVQGHQFRGAKFFERKCCLQVIRDTPTHTKKNGALRVLVPIERWANSAAFCLYHTHTHTVAGDWGPPRSSESCQPPICYLSLCVSCSLCIHIGVSAPRPLGAGHLTSGTSPWSITRLQALNLVNSYLPMGTATGWWPEGPFSKLAGEVGCPIASRAWGMRH
jgi:hypothetical protein